MKKTVLLVLIFTLCWVDGQAQETASPNTGIAIKSYFLKRKKIMATYFDLAGRPILEWCLKPEVLNAMTLFPYIRFYHYDGSRTTTTTYTARLYNEKEIVFNNPSYPLVQVVKMNNNEYESVIDCFPLRSENKFDIDEVAEVGLKGFREWDFAVGKKLVSDDGVLRVELYPYFFLTTQKASKFNEPILPYPGNHLIKVESQFDESGRAMKKQEFLSKDFTFSKTPVFKVKSTYQYIYENANTEHIFIRDKQKMRTYKITVENQYH